VTSAQQVLVLGGGFGGAAAALSARRALAPEHRVTLIDRGTTSHLCGANPLIMVGAKGDVSRSMGRLAARGIEVVTADITRIDLDAAVVETDAGTFGYDSLVVALGASYDWDAIPGAAQAYSFYEREGAVRLRDRLAVLESGSVVIGIEGTPYRCPPAPLEGALLLDWAFRRRGIRHAVSIDLAIPEPAPLAVAGPDAARTMRQRLEEQEVALHTGRTLSALDGPTAVFSDGSELPADVVITVPIHLVPAVVSDSGLTGGKPWVPVHAATLETARPGVFAVGDVNSIPVGDKAIPKAGAFASGQGALVGSLIASRILGVEPPPPYEGIGHCFIALSGDEAATVGGRFLAPGGPEVGLGDSSAAGMAAKAQWEVDWEGFHI